MSIICSEKNEIQLSETINVKNRTENRSMTFVKNGTSIHMRCRLGVPTTSWILLADSQKLSLIMKPISVFWSDKPPWRPSLAQPAWSAKLSRQGRPSLGVDGHDPILKKFTFLRSSWKTVKNMYPPACSDKKISKVGTPSQMCFSSSGRNLL